MENYLIVKLIKSRRQEGGGNSVGQDGNTAGRLAVRLLSTARWEWRHKAQFWNQASIGYWYLINT